MRRLALGLVLVSSTGLAAGAAASLGVTPRSLGAASVTVPRCTTGGIGIIQNLSGSDIVSVTVSGLPAACGGGQLQLVVRNGSAGASGTATVPSGGGSITVTLVSSVAAAIAVQTELIVTGP